MEINHNRIDTENSSDKISIYTVFHKKYPRLISDIFIPIQVGRERFNEPSFGMVEDNTGDNISFQNPDLGEITANYWVWKNDFHSNYIGFFHYRRYLCFNNNFSELQKLKDPLYSQLDQNKILGWDYSYVKELLNIYDIILPVKVCYGEINYFELYEKLLDSKPLIKTIEIVCNKYPNYVNSIIRSFARNVGYQGHLFVMSRIRFEHYMSFIFDIMNELKIELEKEGINPSSINERIYGHVVERIFTFYIEHLEITSNLKVYECPLLLLQDNSSADIYSNKYCRGHAVDSYCQSCTYQHEILNIPKLITRKLKL